MTHLVHFIWVHRLCVVSLAAIQYLPDETFWDYYEDNRVQNEVFNQAMAGTLRATSLQKILRPDNSTFIRNQRTAWGCRH